MKKNFVKVMLLGALAFSTTVSFIGCKDYDDDIDAVNAKVDELTKSLSDLQTKVGGLVKSVAYDKTTGILTVVGSDGTSLTYTLKQDLPTYSISVSSAGVVTLLKDGSKVSEATITFPDTPEVPASFDPNLLKVVGNVVYYDNKATNVTLPVSQTGSIVAIMNGNTIIGYTITYGSDSASLYIADAVPLKGLIFKPEAYVGGIAATRATNLTYNAWTAGTYSEATTTGETYAKATASSYITPEVMVYYHMNPASVTMDQISSLQFISDDKEYITRAAAFNPSVDNSKSSIGVIGGQRLLKVAMKATSEDIPSLDEGKVAIFGLQVTTKALATGYEAQTVTSDYATIYKAILSNFELRAVLDNGTENSILGQSDGKASHAIVADPYYAVSYDNTLDLTGKIKTYCTEKLDKTSAIQSAPKELVNIEDYGLEYVFAGSNYLTGTNDTPQNEFFNQIKASAGIIDPEFENSNSSATIGRQPLVRVALREKSTGKILSVGWIKIKIEQGVIAGFDKPIGFGSYKFDGCNSQVYTTSVINMNELYDQANLSKQNFHMLYTLANSGGSITLGAGSTGTVSEIPDLSGTTTHLLEWTIPSANAYNNTNLFAKVTYKSTDPTRGDITLTLKASVDMPQGSISDANKISNYWDATKSYVKLDVKEPTSSPATEFKVDLLNAFVGNQIKVDGISEFPSTASLDVKFTFANSLSGTDIAVGSDTYTLSVTNSGTTLKASKNGGASQVIATLSGTHNQTITYDIINANAIALLNKSPYNGDPFTATIDIVVTDDCGYKIPLTNEKFDIKFLRPINIIPTLGKSIQDATTGGVTVDLKDLLSFSDWRGDAFAVSPYNFYRYYGVTSITPDISNVMTTMNNGSTYVPLSSVTSHVYLGKNPVGPIMIQNAVSFGTITYNNNGGTITSEFKLQIPVTVQYKFGSVSDVVTLTVTPTH